MTVNTTSITSGPYTGNGASDEYAYTFKITHKSQLLVYETDTDGNRTLLTVDTDYTVNDVGESAGGTVTRVAGNLPTGYKWYIRANYPLTQEIAFASQGGFFPSIHEAGFDKNAFIDQQLYDLILRRVGFNPGYSGSFSLELPDPTAGSYLKVKADLSGFEFGSSSNNLSSPGTIGDGTPSPITGTTVTGTVITASVKLITDTIDENTEAAGVTIDGVLLKDSQVSTNQINEKTAAAGVTVDGVLLKDSQVNTDQINEKTAAAGVTIDGVLLKDGQVSGRTISALGRVLLQTITVNNDATINVGEGGLITAAFKKYVIELINVVPATDAVGLSILTSTDGGSAYDSGYDYNYQIDSGYASAGASAQPTLVAIAASGADGIGSDTNEHGVTGQIELIDPSAAIYTLLRGDLSYFGTKFNANQTIRHSIFGGVRNSAAAVDAVRLQFSSGNAESGTVKLYGIV